jgi:hypothetical protein
LISGVNFTSSVLGIVLVAESDAMAEDSANDGQANVPAEASATGTAIRRALLARGSGKPFATPSCTFDTVALPDPSEEARFTLSTRTYPTPRAILMRCQGTAFTMTRGPALAARGADQLLILLQVEGLCDTDCAGRCGRFEPGDVAIVDYARPFRSAVTDYDAEKYAFWHRRPSTVQVRLVAHYGLCGDIQRCL